MNIEIKEIKVSGELMDKIKNDKEYRNSIIDMLYAEGRFTKEQYDEYYKNPDAFK